jgi:serine/threonine-protein kinase
VGQTARPYLVMEILLGETLGEFLRREGSMPGDLALTFARQVAAGLAAAHRAGVIHRDIKPDNLFLLGERGEPYGIKVLDFGLAKRTHGSHFSAGGMVLGTIEYMSPEQLLTDPVDARTDVYGLGVVMFRMFTGQLPFDVKADLGMLAHQLLSPAPPPSWLNEAMDPRIELVMLTAMRKHPENRYPTMDDLLADMEIILGLRPEQPVARPLQRDPDRYEPQTPRAREAAAVLTKSWV